MFNDCLDIDSIPADKGFIDRHSPLNPWNDNGNPNFG